MLFDVIPFSEHIIVTNLKLDHGYSTWTMELDINNLLLNSYYDGVVSLIVIDTLLNRSEFKLLLETDMEYIEPNNRLKQNSTGIYFGGF